MQPYEHTPGDATWGKVPDKISRGPTSDADPHRTYTSTDAVTHYLRRRAILITHAEGKRVFNPQSSRRASAVQNTSKINGALVFTTRPLRWFL